MIGPEQLAAGERAEAAGDYLAAAAAYRAVAATPDEALATEAHFCLGRVSWRQGRFDAALSAFESARALAERASATELLARVENGIGAVHYARGNYLAARLAYAAAQVRTSDDRMRGKIILNLGVIENSEGNLDAARTHYERAYLLFKVVGDMDSAALALHNRGMVEADLARWDAADASFLAALDLATDAGNIELVAKTLVNRSEVHVARGALRDAIEHCDRALGIYANVGDEVGRGEALRWRARALGAEDPVAAERSANEAMQIAVRAGARLLEAETARDLGVLRGLLGDGAGGTKLLHRALALFTLIGARREAAEVSELLQRPTPSRPIVPISSEPDA
jgi:tetratricopeptide (TPR) repeat protein